MTENEVKVCWSLRGGFYDLMAEDVYLAEHTGEQH